ncbi:hypothetical protein K440DRAFT_659223 [Wilcoxina mikolae CBS 423.85]|nr:hypothetical protein K440DRAFT_659223 [Wilcoxina mikolae CBS 423.85]
MVSNVFTAFAVASAPLADNQASSFNMPGTNKSAGPSSIRARRGGISMLPGPRSMSTRSHGQLKKTGSLQPVRKMHLSGSALPISLLPSRWTYTPIPSVTSILVSAASGSSGRSKRVTWDDTPRVRIIPARGEDDDFEMDADDADSEASSEFEEDVRSEDGSVASSAFDDNVPLPSSGSDLSLVGTLPSQSVSVSSWLSGLDNHMEMYKAPGAGAGDNEEVSSQDDSSSDDGSLASDVSSDFEGLPLQLAGMSIASNESDSYPDVESVASSDFEEVVDSVSSMSSIPAGEIEMVAASGAGVQKPPPSRIPVLAKKVPTGSCLSAFDKLTVRKDSRLPVRADAGKYGMASIPFSLRVFGSGTVGNLGVRLWTPEQVQRESAAAYLRVSRYQFRMANRGLEFPEPGSDNLPECRIDSTYVTWELEMMNQRRERSAAPTALASLWIPDGEDASVEQVCFPTVLKKAIICEPDGFLTPYARGVLVEVLDRRYRRAVRRAQELETRRAGWEAAARLAREDLARERAEQGA